MTVGPVSFICWLRPLSIAFPKSNHTIQGRYLAERARISSRGERVGNELFQTKSNSILKAGVDIFWQDCQDVTKGLKEFFII